MSKEKRAIIKVNSLIQKRLSSKIEKLSGNQTEMSRLFGSSCAQQSVNLWFEPKAKTSKSLEIKKSHISVGFSFYPFPPFKAGVVLTGVEFVGVPPPPLGFGVVVLISVPIGFEFEGSGVDTFISF